jgi:hypothetical protein
MKDVLIGIISNAIFALLAWGAKKMAVDVKTGNPRLPGISFSIVWSFWLLMNLAAAYCYYISIVRFELYLGIFAISSMILLCFNWGQLRRFWVVGLRGADPTIATGINYSGALALCKNQLEFLGTGAAKLTAEKEFQNALLRCRHDRPAKFLLCKPTAEILTAATKRAGRDADAYRKVVLDSLRVIARLRKDRNLDIEVRFYTEPSIFRLMFIDDSVCLVSYNVFGEGDGSQLPQLHVVRTPDNERVVNSFFYPFKVYFDELWEHGEVWNFTDFLESNVKA